MFLPYPKTLIDLPYNLIESTFSYGWGGRMIQRFGAHEKGWCRHVSFARPSENATHDFHLGSDVHVFFHPKTPNQPKQNPVPFFLALKDGNWIKPFAWPFVAKNGNINQVFKIKDLDKMSAFLKTFDGVATQTLPGPISPFTPLDLSQDAKSVLSIETNTLGLAMPLIEDALRIHIHTLTVMGADYKPDAPGCIGPPGISLEGQEDKMSLKQTRIYRAICHFILKTYMPDHHFWVKHAGSNGVINGRIAVIRPCQAQSAHEKMVQESLREDIQRMARA